LPGRGKLATNPQTNCIAVPGRQGVEKENIKNTANVCQKSRTDPSRFI